MVLRETGPVTIARCLILVLGVKGQGFRFLQDISLEGFEALEQVSADKLRGVVELMEEFVPIRGFGTFGDYMR